MKRSSAIMFVGLLLLITSALPAVAAENAPFPLWDAKASLPKAAAIPRLEGVEFHVIKPYEVDKDGYRYLHGVALAWYKGRLYASFGHNKEGENTPAEEARFCTSDDGGKTWSPVARMDGGDVPGVAVSSGVFLSHDGHLYAFQGAFSGILQKVHTRLYELDETTGKWKHKGVVIRGGFYPTTEPCRMDDGNFILAGVCSGNGNPAAVAISHGDDVTKWDLVAIPRSKELGDMWGESTVILDGRHITNIARYGAKALALVATSDDFGRTWTPSRPSNLPMAGTKPYAGVLSTGQRFLIGTTSADATHLRWPLTIALSKPGETKFSRIFVIRRSEFPEGPGESHKRASLAYPYAIERDGKLYVGYSNSGGRVVGKGRETWNNNSAEMAVIPIDRLKIAP